MVVTFFAWLIPLLMIVFGIVLWLFAALVGSGWSAPRPGIGKFVPLAWLGIVIAAIGIALTGVNIWELFS